MLTLKDIGLNMDEIKIGGRTIGLLIMLTNVGLLNGRISEIGFNYYSDFKDYLKYYEDRLNHSVTVRRLQSHQ